MKKLSLAITLLCVGGTAGAADLMQVYRDALANDPQFAAARATLDAGREKSVQGLSGLLPQVGASANTTWNENEITVKSTGMTFSPNYNSYGYVLNLTQPLFRWDRWVQYKQSKLSVVQAEAQFAQARQDLLLRVSQAYFDVLYAQETLTVARAQKTAIAQQLALAKKSFEVGTATITDTHEAQSRYDLATAQEIAAESDLEVRRRALQAIIGKDAGTLNHLKPAAALVPPKPALMDKWVDAAEKDSYTVQIQQVAAEIAAREVDRNRAGHYPTLDLVANKGLNKTFASATLGIAETDYTAVGVQLNVPIYAGGYVSSKEREAAANQNAAEQGLEAARRGAALQARQSFLGVVSGLSQVRAYEAALVSSKSALESNKLGYEVGVRINIDVLNAEQQVYQTQQSLAKARLDTLANTLRLKASVGTLGEEDLQQVNALLEP